MKKAIGIDLGTTNSVIAFKDTTVKIIRNKENEELTRSCVGILGNDLLVGKTAYQLLERDPANAVLSVKRLMGGAIKDQMVQDMIKNPYYGYSIVPLKGGTVDSVAIILGGKQYTPEQLSAEILKKLKKDAEEKLGDEVTHAVITVPAYFTEKQKNATKNAAQLAGLHVQKLLAEPTAAAIAYGVDNLQAGESKTVLVYDFGGGTFDLSILNIVDGDYLEAGTGGDRWLGGDDIDRKLQELIYKRVEKEYAIANLAELVEKLPDKKRYQFEGQMRYKTEEAKLKLSSAKNASILIDGILEDENGDWIDIDVSIKREEFEDIIRPMIMRSVDLIDALLKEVQYDMSVIDSILLIGGTSCIPLIKEKLVEKYGADKIKISDKPMLAVAEGAGILAHRLGNVTLNESGGEVIGGGVIGDISYSTNHNYYIQLVNIDGQPIHERIIEKNLPLPASTSRIFKTTSNNQKIVKVDIHSDVENGDFERQTFGFFTLDEDMPIQSELVFDFKLGVENADEIFSVEVYPKGKKDKKKTIILGRGHFDEKAFNAIEEFAGKTTETVKKWVLQQKYFEFTSELVSKAQEIGLNNDLDERWHEIETKAQEMFNTIKKEDELEDPERLFLIKAANIILAHYRDVMEVDDINRLLQLLRDHPTADTNGRKEITEEIDTLTNNYGLLYSLYHLKAAAIWVTERPTTVLGDTDAQQVAKYLNEKHEEILTLFRNKSIEEGIALLNEVAPIAQKHYKI